MSINRIDGLDALLKFKGNQRTQGLRAQKPIGSIRYTFDFCDVQQNISGCWEEGTMEIGFACERSSVVLTTLTSPEFHRSKPCIGSMHSMHSLDMQQNIQRSLPRRQNVVIQSYSL